MLLCKSICRAIFQNYMKRTVSFAFIKSRQIASKASCVFPLSKDFSSISSRAVFRNFKKRSIMSSTNSSSMYVLPNSTEVCLLECREAFTGLDSREKLYAHHLAQACFKGGLICLFQTSPESPGIFLLLQRLFRAESPGKMLETCKSAGLSEEDTEAFFIYAAGFYSNMGNYKSFGDTKIVPNIPVEKFEKIVKNSLAYKEDSSTLQHLWESIKHRVYSLEKTHKELGLGDKGTSTYYSSNCTESDAIFAQKFMDSKNISPYNTRLFKLEDKAKKETYYQIMLASSLSGDGDVPGYSSNVLGDFTFQDPDGGNSVRFNVSRGDYSQLMALVSQELTSAKQYVSNELESEMLSEYIKSFTTGSLPAHKDGSRYWIKNKGPIVETYIGFIESYRDPFGVRGEFEGFVAVVNKTMSAKFGQLVEKAEHLLAHLPWPAAYEKDYFLRPDFTSLDVLAFGGSGIPAGINIPNYDDIRQSEGFKNVSLGNVLTAGYKDSKITFLCEEDKELYTKFKVPSFEVQVGLHELLGHGSGKLFYKKADGSFNFDAENVLHTETQDKIKTWYKEGETWDSKFTTLASTYEECRAECVGIYLCLLADVQKIFGNSGDDADDIIYVNWLNMTRAGLLALEFYSPETDSWRQAHMNARFVILRVMLEAGEGLVKVEKFVGEDGKPDITIRLDRAKIISVGQPAIGKFLRKLQVYKSTCDVDTAREMYAKYSDVNDREAPHFLSLRSIVLDRKQPRKLFAQHHTYKEGNEVHLKCYDSSPSGLIQSFVDRFPSSDIDDAVQAVWKQNQNLF